MINLTMKTKELKTYLRKIGSVAKKASDYHPENTVLFASAENNDLCLSIVSSDNIQIKIETNYKIKTSFTLDFGKLFNIVKSSNDDIIEFTINNDNEILIKINGLNINLKQPIIANLYPVFEKTKDGGNCFTTDKIILQKITYCLPKKDARLSLNGLLLDYNENSYTMVATDGHRLAKKTFEIGYKFTKQQSIVPKVAINTILKICDKKQPLRIIINDANYRATIRQEIRGNKTVERCRLTVSCNLMYCEYPNYKRVIPSHNDCFIFDKNAMRSGIESIKAMANPLYNCMRLETDIENKKLTLTTNNAETESASCNIEIITESNEKTEIGLNLNYMLDALKYIGDDTVRLMYKNGNKGALLIKDSEDYTHVIMPCRL